MTYIQKACGILRKKAIEFHFRKTHTVKLVNRLREIQKELIYHERCSDYTRSMIMTLEAV